MKSQTIGLSLILSSRILSYVKIVKGEHNEKPNHRFELDIVESQREPNAMKFTSMAEAMPDIINGLAANSRILSYLK